MSESMDIYKSLNINIEKVMTNSKLLKFFAYYLKTKKMCKHAVNKLPYLLRYVPDQYKGQQMCDEAISEHETLFLTATKIKKGVIKQSIVTLMH